MLKVEFVRYRNILCATILEQGNEIKRGSGLIFTHDGYRLTSRWCPDMTDVTLYLQGEVKEKNNRAASYSYDTEEKAKEALQGFKAAIEAYNASLSPERREEAADIETVIVG